MKEKKEIVGEIYKNVFEPEYDDMKKIKQAHKQIDAAKEFLNKL